VTLYIHNINNTVAPCHDLLNHGIESPGPITKHDLPSGCVKISAAPGQKASPSRSWRIAWERLGEITRATPQAWEFKSFFGNHGDRKATIIAIVYLYYKYCV